MKTLNITSCFRDLGEFRQNNDSILSDMKLKDKLIKDLQFKLEHNEGCEYFNIFIFSNFHFIQNFHEKHFHFRENSSMKTFKNIIKKLYIFFTHKTETVFVMFSDCDENNSR